QSWIRTKPNFKRQKQKEVKKLIRKTIIIMPKSEIGGYIVFLYISGKTETKLLKIFSKNLDSG
ncbi:hypothetical protein SB57_10505, partial [Lactobacillus delbrueckii subsp. bulgaricus]